MADSDVNNIIKRLARLLNQETVSRVLEAGDRCLLHPDQVAMLAQLHTFFRGQVANSEEERGEGEETSVRSRRGRRSGTATGNTPKTEMMRLAKDVRPHPLVTEFLEGPNCNAQYFLGGGRGGGDDDDDLAHFPSQLEKCRASGKQNLAFAHCVHFLETIEKRTVLDACRKCFLYLFFFDVTHHLNRVHNTTHTGSRMGPKQKENTLNLLAGDFFKRIFVDPKECKEVKDKVDKWTKRGKKLDQLCEAFDEGALLILADKLSEDMLDNKYREGEDNPVHRQVFQELEAQELKEQGLLSGATRLGKEVRRFMLLNWLGEGTDRQSPGTARPTAQDQDHQPLSESEVGTPGEKYLANSPSPSDGEEGTDADEVDTNESEGDDHDAEIPGSSGKAAKRKRVNST
ncbi:hypothetical protein ABEF95_004629 [Exophiala dermatitidis]